MLQSLRRLDSAPPAILTIRPVEITYTSVAVTSFSIAKDDSILAGLDTVFFSNLQRAQIFNADSLPFGTRTDKLVPKMTTLEGASEARFIMTRPESPIQ